MSTNRNLAVTEPNPERDGGLRHRVADASRKLIVVATRRRARSSSAGPRGTPSRSRGACPRGAGRRGSGTSGAPPAGSPDGARECCAVVSPPPLHGERETRAYVGSSSDDVDGPRIWKRIFAHDTTPLFGIWYCVGAAYARRICGLKSQTYNTASARRRRRRGHDDPPGYAGAPPPRRRV
jgi:hypothetical protein